MTNENAIITFAVGYQKEHVELFLQSCINNNIGADIYLFAGRNADQLRSDLNCYKHLRVIRYREKWIPKIAGKVFSVTPAVGRLYASFVRGLFRVVARPWVHQLATPLIHFMSKRFFALNDFVKKHHYKNYLFTDIRDVLFQDDPFNQLLFNEIHSGIEPLLIGDDPMNRKWANFALNKKQSESLYAKNIVCAGVVLGSAWAFKRYLKAFIEMTYASLPSTVNKLGADQAIHSYLFHFGMPDVEKIIHNNDHGQIITLHHENIGHYKWMDDKMMHADGKSISIVHQYDRHPALDKRFTEIYAEPGKLRLVG